MNNEENQVQNTEDTVAAPVAEDTVAGTVDNVEDASAPVTDETVAGGEAADTVEGA